MTTIYHNPRCRKSRETLQLLEAAHETISIVKYLEEPPSEKELAHILTMLKIPAIQLVRKNEALWKEQFKGREFSESELVQIMVQNPKLIERPIVLKNGKAALGRPPENVKEIL
ncbi:MAG: arsenate reductase (glutaredoxin) [Alteromonas sp.]|nr:arsenate reductase (glutaredoxin) [Alteromonas sp.]MAY22002.1 arsenate reductase (glutaredoxin) [Flavobacteriaceae bacterium]|tara:strand:+ start:96 stop:437 length:342 start_codon:yes stop_codon:yes gene_type:complete